MRWLAVVNRAAGRSREAESAWNALERVPGLETVVAYTDGPGSGRRIAREARAFDGLIVVGGDGTVSECLSGMDLPRQRLGVVPAGHGMCLGRDLGLCRSGAALDALRQPGWRLLDLMEIVVHSHAEPPVRRLCASTVAVGYVANVVARGRRRLPRLGRAAYAVAATVTAPPRLRVRFFGPAGERSAWTEVSGIVVNNTVHLANFRAFPDARLDDGMLDVMVQGSGWLRQMLHNGAVLAGSRAFGPRAMRRDRSVTLEIDPPADVMADGEFIAGAARLSVACRPAAVLCAARPT